MTEENLVSNHYLCFELSAAFLTLAELVKEISILGTLVFLEMVVLNEAENETALLILKLISNEFCPSHVKKAYVFFIASLLDVIEDIENIEKVVSVIVSLFRLLSGDALRV
ncbi:hypothetical protein HK096_009130, partial [Nowakowskiella sp. JEL0078]